MVQGIQGNVSTAAACYITEEPTGGIKRIGMDCFPPQPPKLSLAGKAFEALTGKIFDAKGAPDMETLVYEIFREASSKKADLSALNFFFNELEDQASLNLQPVLKKCLEIARDPALKADLERRLEKLEERPFQSSEALGLKEEVKEIAWGRLGMLAAAALTGMLVLAALFGPPAPKPKTSSGTDAEARDQAPCFPQEAPVQSNPQSVSLETPVISETQICLPAEAPAQNTSLPLASGVNLNPAPALDSLPCLPSEAPVIEPKVQVLPVPPAVDSELAATPDVQPSSASKASVGAEPKVQAQPLPSQTATPLAPAADSIKARVDAYLETTGGEMPKGMTRQKLEEGFRYADAKAKMQAFVDQYMRPKPEAPKPPAAAQAPTVQPVQTAPAAVEGIPADSGSAVDFTQPVHTIPGTARPDPTVTTGVAILTGVAAVAFYGR